MFIRATYFTKLRFYIVTLCYKSSKITNMQRLVTLYTATFGKKPHDIKPLAGAGSSRSYYRLLGNDSTSVIGTVGDDVRENEAYIALSLIHI